MRHARSGVSWLRQRGGLAEHAAATLGLLTLAWLAFGSHVLRGGFYSDDWSNTAKYWAGSGFWGTVETLSAELGARPLLSLALTVPHALFGARPSFHLALGVVLAVLVSSAFFVLLRTLAFQPVTAGAVAGLALLFPWSDATRLWATAGVNNLAVLAYVAGLALAVRGLRARGRRSAGLHLGALACYLASLLTYEITAVAILLSGCVYLLVGGRRSALVRWSLDAALAAAALAFVAVRTAGLREAGTLGERLADVPFFAEESVSLLASALMPAGPLAGPSAKLLVLAVAVALAVAGFVRAGRADAEARRLLALGVGGVALVASSYALLLGLEANYLHPFALGQDNRGNILAGLGYAAAVYALLALAGRAVLSPERRRTVQVAAAAATLVVALGYAQRLDHDKMLWQRAAEMQDYVLDAIDQAIPRLAPGTVVYTFNYPGFVAHAIPVFATVWDLDAALRVTREDPSLRAYPIFEGTLFVCGPSSLHPVRGRTYGEWLASPYGSTYFVDVVRGRVERIGGRLECESAVARFRPGPRTLAQVRVGTASRP